GLGLHRRDALPGAADAARRHRRLERGQARRSRHARLDDRHRPAAPSRPGQGLSRTMTAAIECLAGQMADAETQWSLGTFGAIAEFSRDAEEPAKLDGGPAALS